MLARFVRVFVTTCVLLVAIVAVALDGQGNAARAATLTPRASSTGPRCTFNGSSLPLITGVSNGSKIAVSCSGLPALHPYLVVGTSLLLAIDPGGQAAHHRPDRVSGCSERGAGRAQRDRSRVGGLPNLRYFGKPQCQLDGADVPASRSKCILSAHTTGVQLRIDRLRAGDDRSHQLQACCGRKRRVRVLGVPIPSAEPDARPLGFDGRSPSECLGQ